MKAIKMKLRNYNNKIILLIKKLIDLILRIPKTKNKKKKLSN
jgi:hypothetical protein